MLGTRSITATFSGACLAALLCCTGCQFNNGGAATSSESFELFPMGPLFKLNQEPPVINPYEEQQRQQDFSDDQTRPSVDMTRYKPNAKRSS
jgi:hypothetical protein